MPNTTGTVDLETTATVTWPVASGYTNGFGSNNPYDIVVPSDKIMNDLGVHFYRLAAPNYDQDNHQVNTNLINRLASFNIVVIIDLAAAWGQWRIRNGHGDDYHVWEHLGDFKECIRQVVKRVQDNVTNPKKLWVSVWNEPDWWKPDSPFWEGTEQNFKDTWTAAYTKLRIGSDPVLSPENKILGPEFSYFAYNEENGIFYFKDILDWMDGQNMLPDVISYHYPGATLKTQADTIKNSWGYDQPIYIGEYLPPTCDPTGSCKEEDNPVRSYGYPGQFAYQIAAITNPRFIGGGLDPTEKWNIGGLKGMDGLIAELYTDKLTNLGYVCKLYTEATSVNNKPVASVLEVTNAEYTNIFATGKDDTTRILMGAFHKDSNGNYLNPVMTKLHLTHAGNYDYEVTLWIIPYAKKNDPFDESDLIEHDLGTLTPYNGIVTIDVTDWSQGENPKFDACYIEVEKVIPPLTVSIDGPTEVPANQFSFWTAEANGGLSPYQYNWEIREHHEATGWDDWSYYGSGAQESYGPPGTVDIFEWKVTVTDADNNTAHYDLFVTVDSSGGGPGPIQQ